LCLVLKELANRLDLALKPFECGLVGSLKLPARLLQMMI